MHGNTPAPVQDEGNVRGILFRSADRGWLRTRASSSRLQWNGHIVKPSDFYRRRKDSLVTVCLIHTSAACAYIVPQVPQWGLASVLQSRYITRETEQNVPEKKSPCWQRKTTLTNKTKEEGKMCPPGTVFRRAERSKSVSFASNELIGLDEEAEYWEGGGGNNAAADLLLRPAPLQQQQQQQLMTMSAPVRRKRLERNLSAQPVLYEENEAGSEDETRRAQAQRQSDCRRKLVDERRKFMREIRQLIAQEKRKLEEEEQLRQALKTSKTSVISNVTEPMNLAAIVCAIGLFYVLQPNMEQRREATSLDPVRSLCYVLTFATEFGSQIWMTFVSGIALFFQVPRHVFGKVQRVLFPLYFLLNSIWAFVVLAMYKGLLADKTWASQRSQRHEQAPHFFQCFLEQINSQVLILAMAFVLQAYVRLFLSPSLVKLIDSKSVMEKAAGVGREVGKYEFGELKRCPHFMRMHRGFRRIHTLIAACNMLAMCLNCMHLYHLSCIVSIHLN
ncbi:unnamed protein product [Notodromas monacha]|uniref:TMEM205-like domain-containing protein n=1 Tax=Notodromas monacha TaxID=399045 RepID=A0A7R9BJ37_9CRUS|nr:unnamed protein product [Notodromas monacha]CAG0916432.1 unnamed protein product [Notodromas monacha]